MTFLTVENIYLAANWGVLPFWMLLIIAPNNNITKIDFIHVDVNIYSAAKIILEKTKKHMNKNSLILFDELVNYPFWWKNGEFKALIETYNKNEYKYVAFDRAKKSLIQIV